MVVVEQSSDDDDTFEAPPGVIFVKRRRAKPKNDSEAMPQPAMSEHDMAVEYAYRRMVNGEFHTGRR